MYFGCQYNTSVYCAVGRLAHLHKNFETKAGCCLHQDNVLKAQIETLDLLGTVARQLIYVPYPDR